MAVNTDHRKGGWGREMAASCSGETSGKNPSRDCFPCSVHLFSSCSFLLRVCPGALLLLHICWCFCIMVCLRSCSHSKVKFLVHSRCSVVVAEYEAVEAMWKYRSRHSVVTCRTAVDWWQASLQCVCMCVCRLGGSLDKALLLDTQGQVSTAIWLDFEIICGNREQRRGWGGTVLRGAPDW